MDDFDIAQRKIGGSARRTIGVASEEDAETSGRRIRSSAKDLRDDGDSQAVWNRARGRLSPSGLDVLNSAVEEAWRRGHESLMTEHVTIGLERRYRKLFTTLLEQVGLDVSEVLFDVHRRLDDVPRTARGQRTIATSTKRMLARAAAIANMRGARAADPVDILQALLRDGRGPLVNVADALWDRHHLLNLAALLRAQDASASADERPPIVTDKLTTRSSTPLRATVDFCGRVWENVPRAVAASIITALVALLKMLGLV